MVMRTKQSSRQSHINRLFNRFGKILCNFFAFTSIHGAIHIADDFQRFNKPSTRAKYSKRTIRLAKCSSVIFWGGTILNCIFLAILMISLIWERLQHTPILNTVDTYYYPIEKVAFPAVTLCNVNVVYRPAMEKILKKFIDSGFNGTILRKMFTNLQILVQPKRFNDIEYSLELERAMKHHNYTYDKLLYLLMQPCDQMLLQCAWLNRIQPCNEMFGVSRSTKGYCCSFNTIDNLRYQNQSQHYVSVENQGLDVILAPEPNEYVSYHRTFYGIQVVLHNPDDFPEVNTPIIVQPDYDIKILIEPTILISDQTIKDLPAVQRKCKFKDERELRFSSGGVQGRKYTFRNCMIDCRAKSTIKYCNCTPFHYDQHKYKDVTVCNFTHMNCIWEKYNKMSGEVPMGFVSATNRTSNVVKCNCLPDCEEIRYHIQTAQMNREKSRDGVHGFDVSIQNQTTSKIYLYNKTRISIGFLDNTCIAYKQTVLTTWDNVFASIGGIFGLCLGASIISFIEIIYFVVVRIIGSTFLSIDKKGTPQNQQNRRLPQNARIHKLYLQHY